MSCCGGSSNQNQRPRSNAQVFTPMSAAQIMQMASNTAKQEANLTAQQRAVLQNTFQVIRPNKNPSR